MNKCVVPDDSALETVMRAQHALLPAHGRRFPCSLQLDHDVGAWYADMLQAKSAGHWRDWQTVIAPLSEYPPALLTVNDRDGHVTRMLGCNIEMTSDGVNWDLESPLARAQVSQEFEPVWMAENLSEDGSKGRAEVTS